MMGVKFSIELADAGGQHILSHTTPAGAALQTVKVSIVGGGGPIITYNPMMFAPATDSTYTQAYSVTLYTTAPTQYTFQSAANPGNQFLVFPRVQPVSNQAVITNPPAGGSIMHQIQTTGADVTGTPFDVTNPLYFMTFSAFNIPGANPSFRFSIPSPGPSVAARYSLSSQLGSGCVNEDVINGVQRIFQVFWGDGTSSYFVWRQITTGGFCDTDPAAIPDLFLQVF